MPLADEGFLRLFRAGNANAASTFGPPTQSPLLRRAFSMPQRKEAARRPANGGRSHVHESQKGTATTMSTPARDRSIVRLVLITNFVATVVVAVTTGSGEAVAAVQVTAITALGGHALMR